MNSCGRGCTLFRREEVRPQKRLFCDGKLVDYKRREVGRLRGKYSRRRGGGRQSRTALCFACRRHAKRAASPHPAALVNRNGKFQIVPIHNFRLEQRSTHKNEKGLLLSKGFFEEIVSNDISLRKFRSFLI